MTLPRHCQAPDCNNPLPADLPWNARYCSIACKSAAARAREAVGNDFAVSPGPGAPDTAKPTPDAFRHLQGDAVLSDWKPHAALETHILDIPNFLRRSNEQRKAAWDRFDHWRAAHPNLPPSAYRHELVANPPPASPQSSETTEEPADVSQ